MPPADDRQASSAASVLDTKLTAAEVELLTRVRNAAQDRGAVFPYARPGTALHLDPEDWRRLGKILDRIVQGAAT